MADWIEIRVPEDHQEGTTATLGTWLNEAGDEVEAEEAVAELETDKVNMEVVAPEDGTLVEILVEEGATVTPGMLLARMLPEGAEIPENLGAEKHEAKQDDGAQKRSVHRGDSQSSAGAERLSPVVRRLLREHRLDAAQISGTGAEGRITREDVLDHLAKNGAPPASAPKLNFPTINAPHEVIPHSKMRKSIAAHMVESLRVAPHVTAVFEMDMTAVSAHRAKNKQAFADKGAALTYTAYMVAASAVALKAVPEVNSSYADDHLRQYSDCNIGVGTALKDKGLIVPVIHKAQDLDLFGIAEQLQDKTGRARDGKLAPADVADGTFTISNHGVSGTLIATPIIINQPQSAILGVGKLEKRVVVEEVDGVDTMVIRPKCYVTLSIDHRALDAWHTNAFLSKFVETIEGWPLD